MELLAATGSSLILEKQRANSVDRFLDAVEAEHSGEHRCLVADSGVRLPEVVRMGCQLKPRAPAHAAKRPRPRRYRIAEDMSRRLLAAYEAGGLKGAFNYAANEPTVLQATWDTTSLLGHFIRRDPSQLGPLVYEVPPQAFGAHELAVAIEAGISLHGFETLFAGGSVGSDPAPSALTNWPRLPPSTHGPTSYACS